jgi:hypothetical protein
VRLYLLGFLDFDDLVERAFHQALRSDKKLSPEMTQLLSLVVFQGYELFPAKVFGGCELFPAKGESEGKSRKPA